jgi:hypothetical protein
MVNIRFGDLKMRRFENKGELEIGRLILYCTAILLALDF